jgi:hypothetical protein
MIIKQGATLSREPQTLDKRVSERRPRLGGAGEADPVH